MIRRLAIAPEVLLHLSSGCVEVIANAVPVGAVIVGFGADVWNHTLYVDIDAIEFTTDDPLNPTLRRCERCRT